MPNNNEAIHIIAEMLEQASPEDLELFIIIIEGYLRKKKSSPILILDGGNA